VAAWVRLTDLSTSRAAVSQQGANASMFTLGYRNDIDLDVDGVPDPAWCFTVTSTDTANAGGTSICTTQFVAPDDYISLIGVYDKPVGKLRLYVQGTANLDGAEPDPVDAPAAWSATNALVIGDSTPTQPWVGDLDHVYAAQRVWNAAEIADHALA
jgi:hypothetical protein